MLINFCKAPCYVTSNVKEVFNELRRFVLLNYTHISIFFYSSVSQNVTVLRPEIERLDSV